jgi:hypothetical protein
MTPKQWKNKIILTGLRKQCTWFPSFWNFSWQLIHLWNVAWLGNLKNYCGHLGKWLLIKNSSLNSEDDHW